MSESPWERKVWGEVWHLFVSPSASVSFLRVKKGYRCSMHYHEHRVNFFAVISGRIAIQLPPGIPPDPPGEMRQKVTVSGRERPREVGREVVLGPGETYKVEPKVWHRFRVLEDGEVVEVYWPAEVSVNDIIRADVGGRDECS